MTGVQTCALPILSVRFSYNRTFKGGTEYLNTGSTWRASDGSWTKPLRPDYTFSIWPASLNEKEAAEEDIIVHIHFDAKYKLRKFLITEEITDKIDDQGEEVDSVELEKREERRGIYRNADLIKMHAYKDAIRRTAGAYVLYPGNDDHKDANLVYRGFHEIIPGLGAFAVKPGPNKNGTGISKVAEFIEEVIIHFQDRANQRERVAARVYDIHKSRKQDMPDITAENIPEYIDIVGRTRLIPDETSVLIGYYKSLEHLQWIKKHMVYNGRTGNVRGAMELSSQIIGAQYLLLHTAGDEMSSILFKIKQSLNEKPRILMKDESVFKDYPSPNHDHYLVFNLEEAEEEFSNINWYFKNLIGYSDDENAFPISCSLTELLGVSGK